MNIDQVKPTSSVILEDKDNVAKPHRAKAKSRDRVSHSCEKLCENSANRSRGNSPLRTAQVSLYGTPLRTPKLSKHHSSKRVSDTAVYASIDRPGQSHVVSYYGGENDQSEYANVCMLDASNGATVRVKEHGSAEGRIEWGSHRDEHRQSSPNPRSRSHSFRNSLRSAPFMRFLRRNNSKEARKSQSDESVESDGLNGTSIAMLGFQRERSVSLPIKCATAETNSLASPDQKLMGDQRLSGEHSSWSGSLSESPIHKRLHTLHEGACLRAPKSVSCSAPTATFEMPNKPRTDLADTPRPVRCKSVSFSSRRERCTSMPIPIASNRHMATRNSTGEYGEWPPKPLRKDDGK